MRRSGKSGKTYRLSPPQASGLRCFGGISELHLMLYLAVSCKKKSANGALKILRGDVVSALPFKSQVAARLDRTAAIDLLGILNIQFADVACSFYIARGILKDDGDTVLLPCRFK